MKKIYIDAGHNYSDFNTGAVGNGMREQDVTFEVALLLGKIMRRHGLEVRLSRPTLHTNLGHNNNSAINARWQDANSWGADYFVSIHTNAGGGTGAETLFYREDSQTFAQTVQDIYSEEIGLRNRRVWRRDDIAVIRWTNMPAILVELAFIDAPKTALDAEILRSDRPEIASALAKGILAYLGIPFIPEEPIDPQPPCCPIRFNAIPEMPQWARPTIAMLVEEGHLQGNEKGLDLSMDMLRIFVILDRAGVFG
ncbi:MAG: N-acetylmuramoyl-L-alanine amidase [Defluviitaleaceae bacterium]|nr:N-acetylmuramoyl-L-alanine amidase [Defluviitaleaceae bacterium]